LPEEFTQLSIAMDEAFQNLARGAENKVEMRQMHENMAEVMTYCSGCHDTYRFNVMQAKATKARK
jgi:cytochrome c556